MRALIVAALVAAGPALADEMVFKSGSTVVRLQDKPCASQRVQMLVKTQDADMLKNMGAGYVVFQGREIPMCWTLRGDAVLVVDEDGDAGLIPVAEFKRDAGV